MSTAYGWPTLESFKPIGIMRVEYIDLVRDSCLKSW
jgi:hypothetical protein